eukprot:361647-Chlamydomonas_euryale.AAC.6
MCQAFNRILTPSLPPSLPPTISYKLSMCPDMICIMHSSKCEQRAEHINVEGKAQHMLQSCAHPDTMAAPAAAT